MWSSSVATEYLRYVLDASLVDDQEDEWAEEIEIQTRQCKTDCIGAEKKPKW
jgi:hypothetical protein